MEHQDWETYIIHCKDPKKDTKEKENETVKKKVFFDKSKKLDQKIEEGDLKHKKTTSTHTLYLQFAVGALRWDNYMLSMHYNAYTL